MQAHYNKMQALKYYTVIFFCDKLQNKLVRIIYNSEYDANTEIIYNFFFKLWNL